MRNYAGELPDRRKRRRTVMSPFRLASGVIAVAFALAVNVAAAQSPAPKPGASDPMPPPAPPKSGLGFPLTFAAGRCFW